MIIRGIQLVGLVVALFAFIFLIYARKQGRLDSKSTLFWVLFWSLFIILDMFPSIVSYLQPILSLESNMYILTISSVLTLFVIVFTLYSQLSEQSTKINILIREQAILNRKLTKKMMIKDNDPIKKK